MNRQRGTLNVILHGTFAFDVDEEGRISALIPHVPGHATRAGQWLAETDLAPGEYSLEGVNEGEPGQGKPPRNRNLILNTRARVISPSHEGPLFAVLKLKRPKRVTSPRFAELAAEKFNHPDVVRENNYEGKIATLQIFTYEFDDDALVRLDNHPWEPAFAGTSEDMTMNLHVFSAVESLAPNGHGAGHGLSPGDHPKQAFASCVRLFQNFNDLELRETAPANNLDAMPRGVSREEAEDLRPRLQRLAQLGRMKKAENRDLNQLWFNNEALDGDPDTCGDAWGCRNC
jgi:hypothetical protein